MQQVILTADSYNNYSKKSSKKIHYATVGSKYQMVIPKQIRQELKIKPGDKLHIDADEEGIITLTVAPKNWVEQNFGALKGYWKGINMVEEVEKIRNEEAT